MITPSTMIAAQIRGRSSAGMAIALTPPARGRRPPTEGASASRHRRRLPALGRDRTRAHQTEHVHHAGREDDAVDDHEGGERGRHGAGGDRGGRGIDGAQQAVHHPRLPADLGGHPASQERNEPGGAHGDAQLEEPGRPVDPAATAQPEAERRDRDHEQPEADHQTKRPEHDRHVRPFLGRPFLEPAHRAIELVGEDQAAELRQRDLVAVASRPPDQAGRTARTARRHGSPSGPPSPPPWRAGARTCSARAGRRGSAAPARAP